VSGEGTPGVTGFFEIQIGGSPDKLAHSKKNGDGFVDSKEWGRQLGQFKDQLGEFFAGMSIPELGKMFNEMDKNHDDKISWDEIRSTVIDVHNQHDLKEELAELEQADNVNEESKQRMADLLATIKKKKPE